jgi:hypothetical protein
VTPFRAGLNEPQLDAISMALASKDVCLIHGPPGTGKTTTVVELIRQAVAQGQRVCVLPVSYVCGVGWGVCVCGGGGGEAENCCML